MPTLLRHRGTLYHRSIIPKSLRHLFHGRVQFWRSLRECPSSHVLQVKIGLDLPCRTTVHTPGLSHQGEQVSVAPAYVSGRNLPSSAIGKSAASQDDKGSAWHHCMSDVRIEA